jgi:Ni,Fe-hydrogenase III small subunit/NAD-dependent dihydropyrimidine dehydrogenase PreA subunit
MLKDIVERLRQGEKTIAFPCGEPELPERFRGAPELDPARCPDGCASCAAACPVDAITPGGGPGSLAIDLGRCLFCPECERVCPAGAVKFTGGSFRMAARERGGLITGMAKLSAPAPLEEERLRLFRGSLALRQVSAGGCNGCEAEINALTNVVFDVWRFGVRFAASPRHADGLMITGPVTGNMKLALEKTWDATPSPRVCIAVGACAISGGPFRGRPEQHDGADSTVQADLYIPGCPPHPLTILDALLKFLSR